MSNHNDTSDNEQYETIELQIKYYWFIKPYTICIEVWEGDTQIIEWFAPPETLKDKQRILDTITSLVGGGEAKFI